MQTVSLSIDASTDWLPRARHILPMLPSPLQKISMPRSQGRRSRQNVPKPTLRRNKSLVVNDSDDDESDDEEIVVSKVSNSFQGVSNVTKPETSLLDAVIPIRTIHPMMPNNSMVDSSVTSPSDTSKCTNRSDNKSQSSKRDYRMAMSSEHDSATLRSKITTKLFRKVKFFVFERHGQFSFDEDTACGLLLRECNVHEDYAEEWWRMVRPTIGRIVTDHHNNCIKAIHRYYPGEKLYRTFCGLLSHTSIVQVGSRNVLNLNGNLYQVTRLCCLKSMVPNYFDLKF